MRSYIEPEWLEFQTDEPYPEDDPFWEYLSRLELEQEKVEEAKASTKQAKKRIQNENTKI
jgi:hypothetical protein